MYVASNIDLQPSKKLNFSSFAGVLSIHNAHQYNSHGHFGGALEWYYYLFGFFAFSDYFLYFQVLGSFEVALSVLQSFRLISCSRKL